MGFLAPPGGELLRNRVHAGDVAGSIGHDDGVADALQDADGLCFRRFEVTLGVDRFRDVLREVEDAGDLTAGIDDGGKGVVPVHVLQDAVLQEGKKDVLEVDRLAVGKDALQLRGDFCPGFCPDLTRGTAKGIFALGKGGHAVVVEDRHVRSPEDLHGDGGGQDEVDHGEQFGRPV